MFLIYTTHVLVFASLLFSFFFSHSFSPLSLLFSAAPLHSSFLGDRDFPGLTSDTLRASHCIAPNGFVVHPLDAASIELLPPRWRTRVCNLIPPLLNHSEGGVSGEPTKAIRALMDVRGHTSSMKRSHMDEILIGNLPLTAEEE